MNPSYQETLPYRVGCNKTVCMFTLLLQCFWEVLGARRLTADCAKARLKLCPILGYRTLFTQWRKYAREGPSQTLCHGPPTYIL
jgi:hypothetical protein